MTDLETALRGFNKDLKFSRKGSLCVALVVTQHARKSLPVNYSGLKHPSFGGLFGSHRLF